MRRLVSSLSMFALAATGLLGAAPVEAATVLVTYDVEPGAFSCCAARGRPSEIRDGQFTVAYRGTAAGEIQTGGGSLQTLVLFGTWAGGFGPASVYGTNLTLENLGPLLLQATASGGFSNPTASAAFLARHTWRSTISTTVSGHYTSYRASGSGSVNAVVNPFKARFAAQSGGEPGLLGTPPPLRLLGTLTFLKSTGMSFTVQGVAGTEISRSIVPEPGTGLLLGAALTLLGVAQRRATPA